MSTTPVTFSGTSKYASDFQQIITRAVNIASLPLHQLNNQKNALTDKATAISSIDAKFTAMGTAITSLQTSITQNLMTPTVSDNTVAKVTIGTGALPGDYKLHVIDPGSQTQTLSSDGLPTVVDPSSTSISTAANFTLTVNGIGTTITPASGSLSDLAKAINTSGAGVQANIVNIGSSSSPDYRLSVQGQKLGGVSIGLSDGTTDLLNTLSTGTLASYQINGLPSSPITSDSRTITLSPGVTVNILKAGDTDISVARTSDAAQTALSSFVTSFNAVIDELDLHRGIGTGALSGDSLVSELSNSLRDIANYKTGGTGIASLSDLGVTFDKNGHLQFSQTDFSTAVSNNFQGVLDYLGSSTSGFLQQSTNTMNSLEQGTNGLLPAAIADFKTQLTHQDQLIIGNQARVDQLQTSLTEQMATADALIASLDSQATLINGIFTAMNTAALASSGR